MAEGEPPQKRAKLAFEETFGVLVGGQPKQTRFTLHSEVFIPRSRFFKAARSERWTTSTKPTILQHDSPEVFAAYVTAVYNNGLPDRLHYGNLHHRKSDSSFRLPIDLYSLADKLQDPRTANIVIYHILKVSDEEDSFPAGKFCLAIYDNLPEGNPLRRLVVDYTIVEGPLESSHLGFKYAHQDFVEDMYRGFQKICFATTEEERRKLLAMNPGKQPKCYYHQHDKEYPECEPAKSK